MLFLWSRPTLQHYSPVYQQEYNFLAKGEYSLQKVDGPIEDKKKIEARVSYKGIPLTDEVFLWINEGVNVDDILKDGAHSRHEMQNSGGWR